MKKIFLILSFFAISILLLKVFSSQILSTAEATELEPYRISYNGTCIDEDGKEKRWAFSAKAVPVPEDATCLDGYCYTADRVIIGLDNGDGYALIQSIFHDTCAKFNGITFKGDSSLGFGSYK